MKKSKAGQELYSLAEALTGTAFTLIFAVALFALLFTGVSTFGHYEQKTHEEPIVYEEYHRGMASDTPVQFYAVSAEAALYTKANRTPDYYAYITMEDEKGNQVVTVMQKLSSSATTLYDDRIDALKLDAGSFVDEINGKGGTLYYGVISDNSLDQQTVLIDSMLFQNMDEIARQQVREKAQIEELQTLELYTGDAPQSTTVVDGSEFVRGGGSWFLLGAVVLLALYIVMWIIRKAGKNAAEQRMAEMTHQAKLHLQEIEQRAVAEAAPKIRGPKIVVDKAAVGQFKNRTDIEVVEVLPGVEGVFAHEFQGCTNLYQISLPDGLTAIGSYAFQGCKSLKNMILPDSDMLIGTSAFGGCTELEHIKIGKRTCLIDENAFEGCEKLIVETPLGTFPISEFRELLKETAKTVSSKSPPDNYVAAWTKEMMRQVDIRRKAAEKTVQKAPAEPAENTPEGLAVLRSLPAVRVVMGTGLQKQWPAIDIQGFFHVFTDEGAATAFAQPNGFKVEKMTGAVLCDRLKEWQRYGITHVRLHQGNRTREFLEKELGYESNFNSDLQQAMIRYLQTKALNINGAAETAKIFWMLLCKMIPERLFLVPFCFEGEDINAPVEDNTLRLFPNAVKLIIKQRTEGKILLFDGYPFADKADGRPMHFRSLKNGATGKEVLSVYTDFNEMLPIWKGRAHFALATFDDFKDNYQPTSGVLINPISQALLLEPKDIEEIGKTQVSSAAEKLAQKAEETKPTPTAKETAQKEPVQPAPTASPASTVSRTSTSEGETEPEAVRILRDKICQKLCDKSYREHGGAAGSYQLELLQGEESWRYFHNWPYASFELNLKTGKLRVDLFTGANSFGYGREDHCAISAERFHEIAVECGMSPELQWFRTEEDWARLFDDQLQSVIDDTIASKRKKDAKEKEERRLSRGVELSAEYWTQAPGMWIESVRILLMQRHGSSSIRLTKENGTYYLQGQALSSAEAVWVERQVEAALRSHDYSTWSSFVGGDRISVTIRTSRWTNVEMKCEAVPTKYYNLLSQLQRLQDYGSKDMRN